VFLKISANIKCGKLFAARTQSARIKCCPWKRWRNKIENLQRMRWRGQSKMASLRKRDWEASQWPDTTELVCFGNPIARRRGFENGGYTQHLGAKVTRPKCTQHTNKLQRGVGPTITHQHVLGKGQGGPLLHPDPGDVVLVHAQQRTSGDQFGDIPEDAVWAFEQQTNEWWPRICDAKWISYHQLLGGGWLTYDFGFKDLFQKFLIRVISGCSSHTEVLLNVAFVLSKTIKKWCLKKWGVLLIMENFQLVWRKVWKRRTKLFERNKTNVKRTECKFGKPYWESSCAWLTFLSLPFRLELSCRKQTHCYSIRASVGTAKQALPSQPKFTDLILRIVLSNSK